MVIMTPSDENECRQMSIPAITITMARPRCATRAATSWRGTDAAGKTANWQRHCEGRGEKLAILNFGTLMPEAAKSLNR